jgi:hypothetical protein
MHLTPGIRPTALTDAVVTRILYFVEQDILLNNAARCARIHSDTLERWLKIGEDDVINDRDTFLAQFYLQVKEKQGNKISIILQKIEDCTKNWQALAWKLEKCFREDFGIDANEFKYMLESYNKLRDDFMLMKESSKIHGVITDGKELDQGRDKEARRITQRIGDQTREEDTEKDTSESSEEQRKVREACEAS